MGAFGLAVSVKDMGEAGDQMLASVVGQVADELLKDLCYLDPGGVGGVGGCGGDQVLDALHGLLVDGLRVVEEPVGEGQRRIGEQSIAQVFGALEAVAVLVGVLVGLVLVAQETVGAGGLLRVGGQLDVRPQETDRGVRQVHGLAEATVGSCFREGSLA
ncbi:hypothetical protein DY245_23425 [Streptomyces inhibens]|uniref:Uncharacterized protein n=1 Tax=Streptomyces inhibens TaxID=2293571 RepID=A0A371Q092_STRIH|nr:hypothetical protein DY245_23425 [Streptomyces inhibens]